MVNNVVTGGYGYVGLAFLLVSVLVSVLALIAVCSRKAWRRRAAVVVLQQILAVLPRRTPRPEQQRRPRTGLRPRR